MRTNTYTEIKNDVFGRICDRLVRTPGADDTTVRSVIRDCILSCRGSEDLTSRERGRMCHELFNRIRGLDVLQDILEDDLVTEIMVNGTGEIFVERCGRLSATGICFESKERLTDIIGKIASGVNRSVNLSSPILDARLPDGSRVNAVLDPVAIDGPSLTEKTDGCGCPCRGRFGKQACPGIFAKACHGRIQHSDKRIHRVW